MDNTIIFIKITDEKIAHELCKGGFLFTQEKVNDNQTLYCFEKTPELDEAMKALVREGNFQGIALVEDATLRF